MKEVPKKHLPDVAGGVHDDGGCIPYPTFPSDPSEYPRYPGHTDPLPIDPIDQTRT